ncbi:hypothetical protein B0H16DRAFT_1472630 [Mycena metata]|uniref:Uncharacterized protein n=1 Tax=Mycena metata TaxID=1033252 RepID=A0AAD7HM54_9AGAR|nr:hypothetical protein B0H16DRAFT_1472630 [Mycena metata]
MANPATPSLLEDVQACALLDDDIAKLLGKFDDWNIGQAPTPRSLSTLTATNYGTLGPFDVNTIPSGYFLGNQPHSTLNIIKAMLASHPQSMKELEVSDEFLRGVESSIRRTKLHSLTFDKSEMTRRTVVDIVLSAAISLAETAWDFAILTAEEHNFSTAVNKGVTFDFNNQPYYLSGPIDYVVTGLDSKCIAEKLLPAKNAGLLGPIALQNAIEGTNHTICPIEAKAGIISTTTSLNTALLQVIGESLVCGQAHYKSLESPVPFILSDGRSWYFGIRSKKTIYIVGLTWGGAGHDEKDILRAIVIWTCSQPKLIWEAMMRPALFAPGPLYTKSKI